MPQLWQLGFHFVNFLFQKFQIFVMKIGLFNIFFSRFGGQGSTDSKNFVSEILDNTLSFFGDFLIHYHPYETVEFIYCAIGINS